MIFNLYLTSAIAYFSFCENLINDAFKSTPNDEQVLVCSMLMTEAEFHPETNTNLMLAVVWEETKFFMKSVPNSSGCAGPLQIKIKYWCPNKNNIWSMYRKDGVLSSCDLITRGLYAFNYYFQKNMPIEKKICLYGPAQNCDNYSSSEYSRRYVEAVLKNLRSVKKYVNKR